MLKRFCVTNFKNFSSKIVWELGKHANYEFNKEIIEDDCITKGMIYGINGSGKSNFGLALFDIVLHLTDKEKIFPKYSLYLSLNSKKPSADFEYEFVFNGIDVVYKYSKSDSLTLNYEMLFINGEEVLNYDFGRKKGYTKLQGAENLQLESTFDTAADKLSRVKYIRNNAILSDTITNKAFIDFTSFVDRMLMFYSLDNRGYQGLRLGSESFTQGIISAGKIKEFEAFLKEHDINYTLVALDFNGSKELYCKFPGGTVPFVSVASTGTMALALFYFWYIYISDASFVYIDEYDAFYHFELAQVLVDLLKKVKGVQIFMSTHNTDLMSNDILRPDAYFILQDNRIKSLEQSTEKELRFAHNLQKMYKAGSFNE